MQHDSLGNALSGMRGATLAAVQNFVDGYLAYESRAPRYLAAAQRSASAVTPRERLNLELLRAWSGEDLPRALGVCQRIAESYPRDLVVVKIR